MIATQTFQPYPEFGNNATKTKPDDAKYAAGFQEADVLPFEWVNWFFSHSSKGITDLNTGLAMVEVELNNILSAGGAIPDGTSGQVLTAIRYVIEQKTGVIANLETTAKSNIVAAVNEIQAAFTAHAANKDNPHEVTKEQVGLGNVPNLSAQAIFDMVHPVGDKYIQYPGDEEPATLFNKNGISSTWTNISNKFAGLSLRFEGGAAEEFNKTLTVASKSGNQVTFTGAHDLTLGSLIVNPETGTQYSIASITNTTVVVLNETPVDLQNNTTVLILQNDQFQGHAHLVPNIQATAGGSYDYPAGGGRNPNTRTTTSIQNLNPYGIARYGTETRSKNTTVRLWKRTN